MKLTNGNYVRPPARYSWWLRQGRYFRYMMRELSSLFVGIFSIIMICGLYQLSQGEAQFTAFTSSLWNNFWWLSVITFLFVTYHSYSWFIVTPKAMPLRFSGKKVAPWIIIGAHMILWLICSIFIWFIFTNGGAQ